VPSDGADSNAIAATVGADVQLAALASKNEVLVSDIAHLTAETSLGNAFCDHGELLPSVMVAFVVITEPFLHFINTLFT
jgi:hypothetical protein